MAKLNSNVLITKLTGGEKQEVLEVIEILKDKGDVNVVEPLLDVLLINNDHKTLQPVIDLLSNMKDKKAIAKFFEIFALPKYAPIRSHLLSIIWNSASIQDSKPFLSAIVLMAIEGDYLTAVEAITVIENLESPFDEEHLLESISACKSFIKANPKSEKLILIQGLNDLLLQMDDQNSDFSPEEL